MPRRSTRCRRARWQPWVMPATSSSQWLARAGYSCPSFEEASVVRTERSCGWLQVRGSRLERDADGGDPGFDFNSVITAIGGQAEVGDGLFIGGVIGWENSDLSDDADNTSVDGDALLARRRSSASSAPGRSAARSTSATARSTAAATSRSAISKRSPKDRPMPSTPGCTSAPPTRSRGTAGTPSQRSTSTSTTSVSTTTLKLARESSTSTSIPPTRPS